MIIETEQDVTKAVLAELARAPNARFREVMGAFVRHLHDFAREVKLTEEEFREAMNYIVKIGQASNETHNEAVLISGSLGFSQLIVMLNNGDNGGDTDASLLGPFWRMHSPPTENGGSIVRSPTPGDPMFVNARYRRQGGQADRRRRDRHLAFVDRGLLREPGPGAGRHEPARQVRHRQGRPHGVPQHQARRLSDPDRRPDRRPAARAEAPQHAARAPALPRHQGRLQDADLADLRPGRQVHRTRTCSSA